MSWELDWTFKVALGSSVHSSAGTHVLGVIMMEVWSLDVLSWSHAGSDGFSARVNPWMDWFRKTDIQVKLSKLSPGFFPAPLSQRIASTCTEPKIEAIRIESTKRLWDASVHLTSVLRVFWNISFPKGPDFERPILHEDAEWNKTELRFLKLLLRNYRLDLIIPFSEAFSRAKIYKLFFTVIHSEKGDVKLICWFVVLKMKWGLVAICQLPGIQDTCSSTN